MKNLKHIYIGLFLASPMTAFAHGQEVLGTLFLQFAVIIVFFVGLFAIKLKRNGKLILVGIYVLITVLTIMSINSLPYNKYSTIINIGVVTVPLTVVVLSYLGLKRRFQKE
jgi:hypothetical protein